MTINLTGGLAINTHAKIWVAILTFLQKWHHACLQKTYTEAEVSRPIGYFLRFQPHPEKERTSPHPAKNIMTLTLISAPANQNTFAWATKYYALLRHCISSTLSNSQYTHYVTLKMTEIKCTIIPC